MSQSNGIITGDENICVAGAGGIGLTLAFRLSRVLDRVTVVARDETLRSINARDVTLVSRTGSETQSIKARAAADMEPQDLVFICVKSQDLPRMAENLRPAISAKTAIVPVVNGVPWWYFEDGSEAPSSRVMAVDPADVLKRALPTANVIGATTMIAAERLSANMVRNFGELEMKIGSVGANENPHIPTVAAILEYAGVTVQICEPFREAMWRKLLVNLATNPLSVACESTTSRIFKDQNLREISRAVFDEGLLVAQAYGFARDFTFDSLKSYGSGLGEFKTSMLQDFDHQRPLELAAICDGVLELAAAKGFPMPLTRQIALFARSKQARNGPALVA